MSGGPLALDLANTVWMNSEQERVDWLKSSDAVVEFCHHYGVELSDKDIAQVREALIASRELIRLLFELVSGTSTAGAAELAASIEDALASTEVCVTFDSAGLPIMNTVDKRSAFTLATNALLNGLEVGRESNNRLRPCSNHSCILWFLDSSKGGRRRWCSMERCGNRAKAKRHYEKSRSA